MTNFFEQFLHDLAVKGSGGEYYVYIWYDSNNKPFYVGMGKGNRYKTVEPHSRSKEFLEIYNGGGCSVKIIAYDMKKIEALLLEAGTISAYNKKGVNLANKQHYSRSDNTPDNTKHRYWIVDGEIQTAQEWCSEYNITYSAVLKRMSRGLTLKEALIYPKIDRSKRAKIDSMDYWLSLGLKPGTDNRAKDLGNHTLKELENIKSRLFLGKSLFGYDCGTIVYDIL